MNMLEKRKENESKTDAENFNEEVRRQNFVRNNRRNQNLLDQEQDIKSY